MVYSCSLCPALVLSAQNKVVGVQGGGADTGLLKRPMQENNGYPGTRRGKLSKPPTAPKGNIRMSEDNCAFEVRVEFQKKTLSPTLKDNRLLEEEIRQKFAFIEERTRAKTRTRKIAAKRAARLTSQKQSEGESENRKRLHIQIVEDGCIRGIDDGQSVDRVGGRERHKSKYTGSVYLERARGRRKLRSRPSWRRRPPCRTPFHRHPRLSG
ncbi:uncharacterized protein LOC127862862 isoform X2 [Dreissena polymorpha]|uniref:uncharacterized protein LOC127862862 isoform X2 n=1 Tax=Dreissena polymorpha TaxID=45954 RepID=UPI0022641BF7|nr:uncharacterized protein LOC127862862 isoform X2 [Dreissena polymorpha]